MRNFEPVRAVEGRQGQDRVAGAAPANKQNETESRKSIMKMKKVKFYATLRGEGLIAALPHTPFC